MPKSATASEQAIEDILAQSPEILAPLLNADQEALVQVARQQSIPAGRTDLVYLAGDEVVLIELKAVKATSDHVEQLASYVPFYRDKSTQPAFAKDRPLRAILLAPSITPRIRDQCQANELEAIEYELDTVLDQYQETLFGTLTQFQVSGMVTSVASLSLLNGYLRFLGASDDPVAVEEAAAEYDQIGKGNSTSPASRVQKFRRAARGLGLIQVSEQGAQLTELGESYVSAGDYEDRPWKMTVEQAEPLIENLYEKPFYSDLTYSLVALLETVFELAKNSHPVHRTQIEDWYASKVGKEVDWGERTRADVVRWLGAYLDELGLISQVEQRYYMTPEGFTLLSYVQIEEGTEMIRSQR